MAANMESVVDTSLAEEVARKARHEHSTATATILHSLKKEPSRKDVLGSGFVIKLDNGRCKVMTCYHVIEEDIPQHDVEYPDEYDIWVRFFHANEDVKATVLYYDEERDLAVLDTQLPAESSSVTPTPLRFSRKRKIGTDVALLAYFNPPAMEEILDEKFIISKDPNVIPGKIVGPLKYDNNVPELVEFPHSCYGIDLCSGGPVVSHNSGRVLGVFNASKEEIHTAIATKTVKAQLRFWLNADKKRNN